MNGEGMIVSHKNPLMKWDDIEQRWEVGFRQGCAKVNDADSWDLKGVVTLSIHFVENALLPLLQQKFGYLLYSRSWFPLKFHCRLGWFKGSGR